MDDQGGPVPLVQFSSAGGMFREGSQNSLGILPGFRHHKIHTRSIPRFHIFEARVGAPYPNVQPAGMACRDDPGKLRRERPPGKPDGMPF